MEKNKLTINKLGKIGVSAAGLMAAAMMNLAAATFNKTPHANATSLGNPTLVYQDESAKYSEKKSLSTMTNIINSDLNKITKYDFDSEAKVKNEVVGYLGDMNENSLELARLYKALQDNTIANSGMSPERMTEIAQKSGTKDAVRDNKVVAPVMRTVIQHYVHMILDTMTLVRLGADEAEIAVMDEGDGKNEFLTFRRQGSQPDLRKETAAVLTTGDHNLKDYLLDYVAYEYNVNKKNGEKAKQILGNNLDKIQALVSVPKKNFTQKHHNTLLELINSSADILPASMFGTQAMRRGLIVEYASSYAMINLLDVMAQCGYDLNNFKIDNIAQDKDIALVTSVTTAVTNEHADLKFGVGADIPLNKNWNMVVGGETNLIKGYNEVNNSVQFLGTTDIARTTDNGKHTILAGAKAGIQLDNDGVSTPFGGKVGYSYQINKNFSLDFGVDSLVNIQRSLLDIGGTIGATYRGKYMTVKFGVGLGYTHLWDKNNGNSVTPNTPNNPGNGGNGGTTETDNTNTTPTNPSNPTYGEGTVVKPAEGTSTDKGDINNAPEQSAGDLTRYN